MQFENAFSVRAPLEEVWAALLDVERVAPCMPGAQVLDRTGEDRYRVGVRVRLGPMSMLYRGEVEISERDDAQHRATLSARATEARGAGTARAAIQMALAPEGEGTAATIDSDVQLSGRAAAMGRGVIRDVAASLVDTFAVNLAAMLENGGAPAGEAEAAAAGEAAATGAGAATPAAPAAQPAGAGQEHAASAGPAAADSGAAAEAAGPGSEAPGGAGAGGPAGAAGEEAEASLPAGKLIGAVVFGRLRDPRTLALLALALAAAAFAIARKRSG